MTSNWKPTSRQLLWIAIMAMLIVVGAFLQIPFGAVPLSMQTYFVMLAGLVLGPVQGALAAVLYLTAGLFGLPVYAGGSSGIAKIMGTTGGFLLSFPLMAYIIGLATRDRSRPLTRRRGLGWGALATVVTFAVGLPWLKVVADLSWQKTLSVGFWPFLPGAVFKLALAIVTYRLLEQQGWLPERRDNLRSGST